MQAGYTFFFKKKIFIIIGVLTVLSLLNVMYLGTFTKSDFYIFSFFGYGKGYVTLREFLTLLIINGLPLYFIGEAISKNQFKNFNEMQKGNLSFLMLYTVIQSIIIVFIGRIFSTDSAVYTYMVEITPYLEGLLKISGLNFMELDPVIVLLDVLILRVGELMILQIIFAILYKLIKCHIKVFLICVSLHLLLFFNVSNYFPLGISSIQRLLLLDDHFIFAVFKSLFVLGITYALGYLCLFFKGLIACKPEVGFDELREF